MAESKWTEVREGDRFEYGHRKITIMKVEGHEVRYAQMDEDKSIWSLTTVLPLPSDWVRVGRGPKPKRKIKVKICSECGREPAEPGQVYCWNCMALVAENWAGLHPQRARFETKLLAARMTEEEREDDGEDESEGRGPAREEG